MTQKQEAIRQETRKRINYSLLSGLIILFVCFAIYFLSQVQTVQKNYLYPYPYQETVCRYAEKYNVDSSLCVAVVKVESKFQHDAVSHRGALGLMQIMPDTGRWIAGQLGEEYSPEKLKDPETNIRYGVWYLASLRQEFEDNDVLALAAYNAGRGYVHEWMVEGRWSMKFSHIESIPFRETRDYVRKVLKSREKYKELYDNNDNDNDDKTKKPPKKG